MCQCALSDPARIASIRSMNTPAGYVGGSSVMLLLDELHVKNGVIHAVRSTGPTHTRPVKLPTSHMHIPKVQLGCLSLSPNCCAIGAKTLDSLRHLTRGPSESDLRRSDPSSVCIFETAQSCFPSQPQFVILWAIAPREKSQCERSFSGQKAMLLTTCDCPARC